MQQLPKTAQVLLLVAAVGASQPAHADQHAMWIGTKGFVPSTLTVDAGATVTFVGASLRPHTIVAENGTLQVPTLRWHSRAGVRFSRAGTYRLRCAEHPDEIGIIIVRKRADEGKRKGTGDYIILSGSLG